MKKVHIISFLIIAIGITVLISAIGDLSKYGDFEYASVTGRKTKVVGELAKDQEIVYDPMKDPNYFSFYIRDENKVLKKVIRRAPKPQDFELSEKIVVTGKLVGDTFEASDILMKCPSKYKNEEIATKS
ncbi:MAG: cytochrome c maturation protein CcmE [Saprospiraceae bacterium]|jgi:cytochrome c-type biogenesis protein CcmE|nr:cytochrome c maturation protein CcmE [Saprospiraceae bacterium]MBL0192204.1 cytochrome c maturation protein CcmE [Saprospiraceae bacterium]MBL0293942.1 cytochrome c maturation protein CcmE [Saprospiraceae bacterium]MBP6316163.1 cytochrome c maturation protein CcmE [Chitinophagaceae bacterium]